MTSKKYGHHTSIPRVIKRSLSKVLPRSAKIVMSDICSCRHSYRPGTLRVTEVMEHGIKIRAYFGSGIANLFVRFTEPHEQAMVVQLLSK